MICWIRQALPSVWRRTNLVEYNGLSASVLGHLFTYSRSKFWTILHCVQKEVEIEATILSKQVKERTASVPTSAAEAECLYHNQGCSWPDEYRDDEELLAVRRTLRRAVHFSIVDWD